MEREDDTAEAVTGDGDNDFDPAAAAALLEQTTKRARRAFDLGPPLLVLVGAPLFLVAFGAAWWSVRDQHPYRGPAGWALAVLYAVVIVWVAAVVTVVRRARAGVGGHSRRQQRIRGLAFGAAWVAVYVFQGALYHAGASHAIVYGIYPATAPFIILGAAAAAHAAAQDNVARLALAIALIALATGAAFAGAASAWLVMGIGLCVLLVAFAAGNARQRPASPAHT